MKSEFTLALNQICSERNLPREIITQVLESALVSSYRKNANIMNSQNVSVKVDIESGDMRVFVEKEVVEVVADDRTEITLEEAKVEKADAEMGDCIMVDVTMKDLGRIAAQNVKQMIVQKLREAERDFQYNSFAEREGEIVHGLVHNITPAGIVLNLGRAEGILVRKEQIPGERYELQQRMRAYVTEVKRSSRGPQIMLSRAHRNMLRRLLEIEVPEVQNAQIEIKSIAREAGSRSKVAVAALKPGIDPVGACVGQRGTRIQGIVNELNGEKIDVIEWNEDPAIYITKSLGPAKVLTVHPTVDAKASKSATVVVPDDQLSLAIGREGQNARLAAKLTGWHIDIKSGSEALGEALVQLAEDARLQQWVGPDVVQSAPALRELLVRQRALPAALTPEEFLLVKRAIDAVRDYAAGQQTAQPGKARIADSTQRDRRMAHEAALAAIPRAAYTLPVERLELSSRVSQHIVASGILSVGQLMERRLGGDEGLLSIEGIGAKALAEVKAAMDKAMESLAQPAEAVAPVVEPVASEAAPVAAPVATPAAVPVAAPAAVPEVAPAAVSEASPEVAAPAAAPAAAPEVVSVAAPEVAPAAVPEAAPAETAPLESLPAQPAEPPAAAAPVVESPAAEAPPAPAEGVVPSTSAATIEAKIGLRETAPVSVDDGGRSPEEIFLEAMAEGEPDETGGTVRQPKDAHKKTKDKDKGKKAGRDRVLIYDEDLGRTVVQRSRKPGRAGDEFIDEIAED